MMDRVERGREAPCCSTIRGDGGLEARVAGTSSRAEADQRQQTLVAHQNRVTVERTVGHPRFMEFCQQLDQPRPEP
jgi:hypothetical protein